MEEKTTQKFVKTMERLCRAVERIEEGLQTGRFKTEPDYAEPECDFCTALKNANKQNKELGIPSVSCELNGARASFRYCPECGRKL